ncbi:MAG: PorT family protein [Porphyromonadaceae bacterium]|nr:PorT family protein [Porphyromonadaceae bacterium]
MKNRLLFILTIFIFCCFVKGNAQYIRFGIQAGAGIASAFNYYPKNNDLKDDPEMKLHNSPILSYSSNLYISYPLNDVYSIAVEPGLIRKGFSNQFFDGYDELYNRNFLYYFQLPVLLEFKFDRPITLSIGPEFGYLLSAKLKEKYDTELMDLMHYYRKNRVDLGLQGGGFYSFSENFDFGLKIGFSFTNLDKFYLGDTEGYMLTEIRRKALYINAFTRYKF